MGTGPLLSGIYFLLFIFASSTFFIQICESYNGLKITPKPCTNKIGEVGTCMFAWECIQLDGKRLGTCADGFLFGMCCGQRSGGQKFPADSVPKSTTSTSTTTTTPKPVSTSTTTTSTTTEVSTTAKSVEVTSPLPPSTSAPSSTSTSSQPVTLLKIKFTSSPGGQRVTVKPRPSSPVTHITSATTPSVPKSPAVNLVKFPSLPPSVVAVVPIRNPPLGEVVVTSRPQVHFPSSVAPLAFTSIRTSLSPFTSSSSLRSTLSSFGTTIKMGSSTLVQKSTTPSLTMTSVPPPPVGEASPEENDVIVLVSSGTSNKHNSSSSTQESSPSNSPLIASTTPSNSNLGVTQAPQVAVTSDKLIHGSSSSGRPSVTLVGSTSPPPPLSAIDATCGRRRITSKRARIVGGAQSKFSEWPWMVSLRQWKKNAFLHKCGAALLNNYWAITAAHCVENVAPNDLLLRLGEFDVSNENEPYPYVERRVQIIAPHPEFDPRTFEYDLALLRFYEPVHYRPNIVPICVPSGNESYVGKWGTVTGWGRLYEDGPLPDQLQHVDVPVITNKECETMYRKAGYVEEIPNIFICAGLAKGSKDSCEGDSGGPLVMEQDGKWQLIGIISWGIGCALPNQPGVYTRITEFSSWINQIIAF